MSSLWMKHVTIKNKYKPSPATISFSQEKPLSHPNKNTSTFIKRISMFISDRVNSLTKSLWSDAVAGSMTVEAAVLIPVVLFFFFHLAGVMEMLRLHGKLEAALWNAGNQAALYAGTFTEEAEALPDAGISYLLIHNQVTEFLGKAYLEDSPLARGAAGLNYLRSEYMDEEECVDIIVTYQVEPMVSIFPFSYRRMSNRYYARAWTGYDVAATSNPKRYVYVTSRGEVWHSTPECSYIYHTVLSTSIGQIGDRRNKQGQVYEVCDFCGNLEAGKYVYFTEEGGKYHYIRNCTAIYKDIQAIVWSDELPYRACSRCGM